MAMASKCGLIVPSMKASGKTTKQMAMANSYMPMEMYMRVSGRMIKHTEWVTTSTQMGQLTMENGKMINSMERELKLGPTVQSTKDSTMKARNTEKGLFNLLTAASTLGTSNLTKYLEKENMYGQMVSHMKVNGRRIKCMDMEF